MDQIYKDDFGCVSHIHYGIGSEEADLAGEREQPEGGGERQAGEPAQG